MKHVTKIAIGVVAALGLGLATMVVSAHPYGYGPVGVMGQGAGYGPGAGMGPGMGPAGGAAMAYGPMAYGPTGRRMGPQAGGSPAAAAERRLSGLKSELKITSAQESAWKAFAGQAKQRSEAMQALMRTVRGSAQASAPERLELRNQVMRQRQEQMKNGSAAFKELYAVLTPEQRALADRHIGRRGGRGMAFNAPAR